MSRFGLIGAASILLGACAATPVTHSVTPSAAVPAAATNIQRSMVLTALSMLGQPYRFGGDAPGGFDCSGLVEFAAAGAGMRLPRTAREQMHSGIPVARDELQPGDLIFMHLAHKELHVGIAIDNQRFIHAPSTGGFVRVDARAAQPYAHGFVTARRVASQ